MSALRDAYDKLLEYLREYSTPHFSMRYQGQRNGDTTLPGMWAISTMLHNPNQLTIQMSTATTLGVTGGRDLVRWSVFQK